MNPKTRKVTVTISDTRGGEAAFSRNAHGIYTDLRDGEEHSYADDCVAEIVRLTDLTPLKALTLLNGNPSELCLLKGA